VKWAERQLQRSDPRVRANAIEGLWGLDSPEAVLLLESLAKDGHNRVAGNALVGLHVTGKADITEEIERLSKAENATFRSTAAWMMGRIGNAGFLEPLGRLRRDENAVVRGAALRAMIEIRRAASSPALNLRDNNCVDNQGQTNGSNDGGSYIGTDSQPAGGEEVLGQRDGAGDSADSGNG
jgi:HEAT repeat protein